MAQFTPPVVAEIRKNTKPELRHRAEDDLAPAVEATVLQYVESDARAFAIGRMFAWGAMGGNKYLQRIPDEIIETFGYDVEFSHTLSDAVIQEHKDLFEEFIESVNPIRLPWKSKVKPELLKNAKTGAAPAAPKVEARTPAPQAPPPRKSAPEKDHAKVSHRKRDLAERDELTRLKNTGLRHADSTDRLSLRVRMIEQLAGISFPNKDMEERFRHAIRPVLKGVKSSQDATRALSLSESEGGLGMSMVHVDEVMALIERLHDKDVELAHRAAMPMKQPAHDLQSVAPAPQKPKVQEEPKKIEKLKAPAGDKKKIDNLIAQEAASQQGIAGLGGDPKKKIKEKKMHDVVEKPLTMGPVEEMRTIDLTDFRQLSTHPDAAGEKLKKRFELLKEDGIDRYSSAVKAWHQSPLYGLYIQTMQDALKEGRPFEDMAAIDTKDPERFSKDELDVIIKLNKSLRF